MTPAYFKDMQIIDERLTALEDRVEFILESLIKIEKILLEERSLRTLVKSCKFSSEH